MDKIEMRELILSQIERPFFPVLERSVLEFGAVPQSEAIQTEILQKAIDTVSAEGGGKLVIPAGRYKTGALHLKSGVRLHLESRETVLAFAAENIESHYPVVFGHWEASPCYNFSALIYACDAHDIALTGEGVLDGGADKEHWWNWHHQVENAWSLDKTDLQMEDRMALRKMNMDGTPVEKRIFGPGHYLRPNFVQLIRCSRILLQGITLKNSPMWQLNPVMCKSLTIDGVTLSSHGANNDGCDPESCRGVHIVNCRFDTGDDCISLKSGRDRDGQKANIPCEYVLIEHNDFADGHGGVALGSEMSGGIRCVLAWKNHFTSPNLTYALRFKTNARRGGRVEDIILADSVITRVHGAAIHGTMLYEDGRNGNNLPVFKNITIENITAHGGDYGIFLEAFDEVPVTGLILKNISIDGTNQAMHSMNWKDPVIENVVINGQQFPRPGKVRILGIPKPGDLVSVSVQFCGGYKACHYQWEISCDGKIWENAGKENVFTVPKDCRFVRVKVCDGEESTQCSRRYRVISRDKPEAETSFERQRLICREILGEDDRTAEETYITRKKLAQMLLPFAVFPLPAVLEKEEKDSDACLHIAIANGFFAEEEDETYFSRKPISRQEMATVVMQICGVNYRNASTTMPVCADVDKVSNSYGTNVARALYFGFMEMGEENFFCPEKPVTMGETIKILNKVADFAGL